jgi:hypothetical protein
MNQHSREHHGGDLLASPGDGGRGRQKRLRAFCLVAVVAVIGLLFQCLLVSLGARAG